jgi:hypothetical protein
MTLFSYCHPEPKPKDLAFYKLWKVEILHFVQNDIRPNFPIATQSRCGEDEGPPFTFYFLLFLSRRSRSLNAFKRIKPSASLWR